MKKRFISLAMVGLLCICICNMALADHNVEIKDDELQKERKLKQHMIDLVEGRVNPTNEDADRAFQVITYEEETKATDNEHNKLTFSTKQPSDECKLIEQDKIVDIIEVDENEYQATAILDNDYMVPVASTGGISLMDTTKKTKTLVNVKVACTMTYSTLPTNEDIVKVSKYVGQYVSTNDPQMKCSQIAFLSKAFGKQYNSAGQYVRTGSKNTAKKTYNNPGKGVKKTYNTGQTTYFRTDDPGYNVGRFYYTVKRTVSSYTKSSYMSFNFGSMTDVFN